MEPKDSRNTHFVLSIIKSTVRINAGVALLVGMPMLAGALLIVSELFGVAEEL